jgi:hypothetical protein
VSTVTTDDAVMAGSWDTRRVVKFAGTARQIAARRWSALTDRVSGK